MKELPPCTVEGCENNARSAKGGYCMMHYTRIRAHGDPNINLYGNREQEWILPDGTRITNSKTIKNISIIIDQIKDKRLLGYQNAKDDTLDIIERVLDDYHGEYKRKSRKSGSPTLDHIPRSEVNIKRGANTKKHARYITILEQSDEGFERGLITINEAELISMVVRELSSAGQPIKFDSSILGTESNKKMWLAKAFVKFPIIGVTYNDKTDTLQFTKDISQIYDEMSEFSPERGIKAGLHYERISKYEEHIKSRDDKATEMAATRAVIEYLRTDGNTDENTLFEKCYTNKTVLQKIIEANIGVSINNEIVSFTMTPRMNELLKKDKELDKTDEKLSFQEQLDKLGVNHIELVALEVLK